MEVDDISQLTFIRIYMLIISNSFFMLFHLILRKQLLVCFFNLFKYRNDGGPYQGNGYI